MKNQKTNLTNPLIKMKKQNKILDLTNNNWIAEKRWNKVGLKQSKIKLTKTEKIATAIAIVNIPIPCTFSPITSPLIIAGGRKLAIRHKVKLR